MRAVLSSEDERVQLQLPMVWMNWGDGICFPTTQIGIAFSAVYKNIDSLSLRIFGYRNEKEITIFFGSLIKFKLCSLEVVLASFFTSSDGCSDRQTWFASACSASTRDKQRLIVFTLSYLRPIFNVSTSFTLLPSQYRVDFLKTNALPNSTYEPQTMSVACCWVQCWPHASLLPTCRHNWQLLNVNLTEDYVRLVV